MNFRTALLMAPAFLAVTASLQAADLGFITIDTREQLEQATSVFDHAYARDGHRFLVSADSRQQEQARKLGLVLELAIADADPSNALVVYPSLSPDQAVPSKSQISLAAVNLGDSRYLVKAPDWRLVPTSDSQASRPLSEFRVRFSLEPVLANISPAQPADYPSDSVVSRISRDSVYAFDSRLQAFRTRFFRTDSVDRARDWLYEKFQSWGYADVSTPEFWVGNYWSTACNCWRNNVRAIKPGWAEPDQVIVVGAHFDSYSTDPYNTAPGADDNASGTSVVLELARIFKDIPLRKTVIFMPFGAEEIWMYGSGAAAQEFADAGVNIEVMYNYDMVGFDTDGIWTTKVQASPAAIYGDVSAAAARRLTAVIPVRSGIGEASDHTPFLDQGYNVVYVAEGTFNTPNYHQITDSTTKLDFGYMTDIAKMGAAALAYVGDAARTTPIDSIVDQGDGHALELFWSGCHPDYSYTLYRGTTSGWLRDSILIPSGTCSYRFDNLTEGTRYYFAVLGKIVSGNPSLTAPEASEIPQVLPRIPAHVSAESFRDRIRLSWTSNHEADLDHYRIYRKFNPNGGYALIASTSDTQFSDTSALHWLTFSYRVSAVDRDGNESGLSDEVAATLTSLDKGILIADEMTPEYDFMPSQEAQEAYFDTVFGVSPHDVTIIDNYADALKKSLVGQYSSIFWIDDDIGNKLLRYSADSLRWYAGFGGNIFVCGYSTIQLLSATALNPGNLLYDEFGLQSYSLNYAKDFAGAKGQFGWPSVQLDPTRGFAKMGDIPSLTPLPNTSVIYRYDSNIDDPTREDQPVGLVYDSPSGKRVLLAFPLYYLTASSAQSLVSAVKAYFGENAAVVSSGDLNLDGIVDIEDLVELLEYLVLSHPLPAGASAADVDASCTVDVSDLVYLIDYLWRSGPAPSAGCVPLLLR